MDGRIGTNGFDANTDDHSRARESIGRTLMDGGGIESTPRRKSLRSAYARRHARIIGLFLVFATSIAIVSAVALVATGRENALVPEKTLARPPPFPFVVFGFTYDSDGVTPLVGAIVTITNMNTTESSSTVSIDLGYYQVDVNDPAVYPTQYNTGNIINVTATFGTLAGSNESSTNDPDASYLWIDVTLSDVAIPEFSTLIMPVVGIAAMVVVVRLRRRG